MEGNDQHEIATNASSLIGVLENVNVYLMGDLINQVEQCKEEIEQYNQLYEEMKHRFNEVHH